ncbi:hypothetical protein [Plesiomonas shigelloides]
MIKTCYDLVKYILDNISKLKDESLNRDLVHLLSKLEECHSAYEKLNDKSERSDIKYLKYNHEKTLEELEKILHKFIKYFEIEGNSELVGNLKVYVALESYASDKFHGYDSSLDEHLGEIINKKFAGNFDKTHSLLKAYISQNVQKKDIYKHLPPYQ